jgi:hypothetical protein
MIRFGVNTLLVLGLLFSQLAAAPHMHAADVHHTNPHGGQRHFHLHRFLPAEVAEGEVRAGPPARVPCVRHDCPYDHDADAFYLPDNAGESGRADAGTEAKSLPAPLPCLAPAGAARAERVVLARERAAAPPGCPLYVRHRALLN